MKLINVRLDPDDERRADALRRIGITVSEVVRRAIRSEYDRRVPASQKKRRASEIIAEIHARYPVTGRRPRVDLTDRRAVQRFIRAQIQKKLRKSR
jgi:Arc/MetJ-type ribon-helix-helix transcriptional regulator